MSARGPGLPPTPQAERAHVAPPGRAEKGRRDSRAAAGLGLGGALLALLAAHAVLGLHLVDLLLRPRRRPGASQRVTRARPAGLHAPAVCSSGIRVPRDCMRKRIAQDGAHRTRNLLPGLGARLSARFLLAVSARPNSEIMDYGVERSRLGP